MSLQIRFEIIMYILMKYKNTLCDFAQRFGCFTWCFYIFLGVWVFVDGFNVIC